MLAITALRLAALEALAPSVAPAAGPRWPTLAQSQIYDSRFDPIERAFTPGDVIPVVVMTVERIDGPARSAQNGGLPFDLQVRLVFDIQAVICETATDPGGGPIDVLASAETDAELEDDLDLISEQILRTLAESPLFRAVRARAPDCDAVVYRDAADGRKLAIRALSLMVQPCADGPATLARLRAILPPAATGVHARISRALDRLAPLPVGPALTAVALNPPTGWAGTAPPAPPPPAFPVQITPL